MNKQMARTLHAAVGIAVAAFALSGCAGSPAAAPPPATQADAMARTAATVRASVLLGRLLPARPDERRSWMSPAASKKTLLYVSDIGTSSVEIFTYPEGTVVGELTGFGYPQGECSDASGNVYITDAGNDDIVEYAHGGTSPIATYPDAGMYPASCAIDPASGNLAVANLLADDGFEVGNIAIYPKGSESATLYTDPNNAREYFLTYDGSGNIFVDGVNSKNGAFQYAEMSSGGTFSDITIKGAKLDFPGGVALDGANVAVVDQQGPVLGKPDVYDIAPSGKAVRHTTLSNASGGRLIDPVQFVLTKGQITIADALGGNVYLDTYPKGAYTSSFSSGLVQPLGVTLSK